MKHPTALSLLLLPLCTGCPSLDLATTGESPDDTTGSAAAGSIPTTGADTPTGTSSPAPGETTLESDESTSATTHPVSTSATTGDDPDASTTSDDTTTDTSSSTTTTDTSSSTTTDTSSSTTTDTSSSTTTTDTSSSTTDPSSSSTDTGVVIETYKVNINVIGLVADAATLALGADMLAVTKPGEHAFPGELADGTPFEVTMVDAPTHYDCALSDEAGVIAGSDVTVELACVPKPGDILRITEFGLGYYSNDSFWIELTNVGAEAQQLAGVQLRAPAHQIDQSGNFVADKGMQEFALPAKLLAPGERIIVRGHIPGRSAAGPRQLLVTLAPRVVPHWGSHGAIELRKGGASLDYVAWGTIPPAKLVAFAPAHPSAWPAYPAGLPIAAIDASALGRSVARKLGDGDSNAAADLAELKFSTPGGPNDTHGCLADGDNDGIPDCSELVGKTYAGVPLHVYGARQNQRDIFVEIDRMDPKGGDGVTVDAGLIPQRAALDRIVAVFQAHGFALHFDVGDLHDQAGGLDPADHDLGGGSVVPFSAKIGLTASPGNAWVHQLKADTMDLPRLKSFHYAVFADAELDGTLGGRAERPGNDLYVALGTKKYKNVTQTDKNFLANEQAQTLMHELGHNFGLSHGGYSVSAGDALADEANWKPNYYSIMNYLYGAGLPASLANAADRYYFEHEDENPACIAKGVDICTMSASMCGPTALLGLDYSHGLGGPIEVAKVQETAGVKQPGSAGIDFDCDGALENVAYAHDLYAAVDGDDEPITVLRDHDDWAALDLYFAARVQGFNNSGARSPADNDIQPLAAPDRVPASHLRWLARRAR